MLSLAFVFIDWKHFLIPLLMEISSATAYWHFIYNDSTYLSRILNAILILIATGIVVWLLINNRNPVPQNTE